MTDQSIEEVKGWLKPSIGETYILLLNESEAQLLTDKENI